jgi:hypothetical protein
MVLTATGSDVGLKKGVGDKSHQLWEVDDTTNGFQIKQNKHDNCYLGVSNNRVVVKKGTSYETIDLWELKPVTKNDELRRCSYIQCTRTGKLMDVPASQEAEGVHICIWEPNHRFNQRWKIYKAGDVFIIKSFKTDLNLDVEHINYENGTKIIQWYSTGGHNQFWKLQQKQ